MKNVISSYSFDATTGKITFTDYGTLELERVLLVTDVTTNTIIYQFNDSTRGGSVSTNVLSLDFDTTALSDGDALQIFYDCQTTDPDFPTAPISGEVTIGPIPAGSNLIGQVEVFDGTNIIGTSSHPVRTDPTGSTTQPISGTVTVNAGTNLNTSLLALESGGNLAALAGTVSGGKVLTTETNSGAIKTDLDSVATNTSNTATNTTNLPNVVGTAGSALPTKVLVVAGSDGTDARAIKTDTSGNVNVNVQGTVPVSGTFWQATQPISATALPLPTGAATSALQTSGNTSLATIATAIGSTLSVSASSFGGITSQSSGSITVADSGSTTTAGQNGQSIVTGTATTGSFIAKSISDQTVTINISGIFSATLVVEVDVDLSTPTWVQRGIHQSGTSYVTSTFTGPAIGHMNISGMDAVRVRCTNYVSGSISVTITQGSGLSSTYIANPIQLADGTTPSQHLAINASGQITEANSTGIKSDLDTLVGTVSSSKINVNISSGGSTNYALETGGNLAIVAGTVSGGKVLVTETSAAGIKTDLDTISGAISGGKMLIARTDTAPATGTISAQDTVSATATGMNSQSIITGTPTANSFVSFALAAQETVGVQITGTWTGTLQSEISFDGGTEWYIRGLHQPGTTFTTSAFTGNGAGICNVGAVTNYRIRATATWTGSATIRVVETGNDAVTYIANAVTLNTGAALIGQVSASNETSTVFNGATALTPLFATIVASSSGATSLVAAVTSKRIRVLAAYLTANGGVNVKFQSHVTPTDLTGLAYLTTNTGFVLPYNPLGWFQTVSGEQLDINLSGSIAVGGTIVYVTV